MWPFFDGGLVHAFALKERDGRIVDLPKKAKRKTAKSFVRSPARLTTATNEEIDPETGTNYRTLYVSGGQLDRIELANHDWVINPVLAHKSSDLVAFVHRDADKLQSLRAHLLLQTDEDGNFFQARRTPGRPEIHYQHLALPVADRLWRAGKIW